MRCIGVEVLGKYDEKLGFKMYVFLILVFNFGVIF